MACSLLKLYGGWQATPSITKFLTLIIVKLQKSTFLIVFLEVFFVQKSQNQIFIPSLIIKGKKSSNYLVSPGEIQWYGPPFSSSGWVECNLWTLTFPGIINVKSCFPDHSGTGLRIMGIGNFPSQEGKNMTNCIICSFVMKTSLLVIFLTAVSVS